ncbi:MAG: putative 2OG-Fe(II) oxygenase [Sneathiella sp.]
MAKTDLTKQKFQGKYLLPKGQDVVTPEKNIALTHFPDMDEFNGALETYLVKRAQEKLAVEEKQSASKSTKIHHVDAWEVPGARFIHERALTFFRTITGLPTAVSDLSWANVYQKGDYILPHAHSRSVGSIVYVVSMGDDDDIDPMAGKFAIADPRLAVCRMAGGNYMSNTYMPEFKAGSMIIFPSDVVHLVTPYQGDRPRITLAWNINAKSLPPRKAEEGYGIPPHPGQARITKLIK